MFRYTAIASIVAAATFFACDRDNVAGTTHTTSADFTTDKTQQDPRDLNGPPSSPHQSNDPVDLETTQRIRESLMTDENLSVEAKNVQIFTSDGVVTLRGDVPSESDRTNVEAKALQLAGGNRLMNSIDVEPNTSK